MGQAAGRWRASRMGKSGRGAVALTAPPNVDFSLMGLVRVACQLGTAYSPARTLSRSTSSVPGGGQVIAASSTTSVAAAARMAVGNTCTRWAWRRE